MSAAVAEDAAAVPPELDARRRRTRRRFLLFVATSAVVASWNGYRDAVEPTGFGFLAAFFTFIVLAPIGLWSLFTLFRRLFGGEPIGGPALLLLMALAPWAAFQVGGFVRDRDFHQRRRPAYEKVIAAIRRNALVDGARNDAWLRDLTPEERATFRTVNAMRDSSGRLAVSFYWAGYGVPPVHLTYWWFESGRVDEEELRHARFAPLGDGWYDSWD